MRIMKFLLLIVLLIPYYLFAQISISSEPKGSGTSFPIVNKVGVVNIIYDSSENILVNKVANFLASDIESVSDRRPTVLQDLPKGKNVIIIGTIGNSSLIDQLVSKNKINVESIEGKWESFMIQTVVKPFPNVDKAIVIVGSDRRGAAFGVFTLSEKIGVSPWYWWGDVPVKKKAEIYLKNVRYVSNGPAVKYRGIFINDESPAFRNWANEKFGGINHHCYEKVYELLLRNKANFLWPAMWLPTMFYTDDPLNPKTANDYGIVISTSHHEPMMRAHNEWAVFKGGAWDYQNNKNKLQKFWKDGIQRTGNYESVITVGMRGDGDEGMSEETAVDLLKNIIEDQRKIITQVTKKPANEIPQVWALYKEVQDYYDKGMRVDDDITILFSDDNWGNIRYLPKKEDLKHPGGYGMYYHFDYVGAPVSYRWQNVTQIERVWEQMNLTYSHGVNNLWIANVGDIKPMELPISFFLDYAWDPEAIKAKDLPLYYENWTKQQFGDLYTKDISNLLTLYTKYNARRTPEMLTPNTYSIDNFREADNILKEFNDLVIKSKQIYEQIDPKYRSSFYQLVLSPIEMCANLNEMFIAAGLNKYYADRGAAAANYYADKVKELFEKDFALTKDYHENLENGKWNHMMSQNHIGYTSWNQPPLNIMPAVSYVQLQEAPELGFLLEYGDKPLWGWLDVEGDWGFSEAMPIFDEVNKQNYYIDIINRGKGKLKYKIKTKQNWIKLSAYKGEVEYSEKVYVTIDWDIVPKGRDVGEIIISDDSKEYLIKVPVRNDLPPLEGFIENNGVVSIDASIVPNLGRTGSSITTEPANADTQKLENSPSLEYEFSVFDGGEFIIESYLSPNQDFKKQGGLKFAISIDDEDPKVINVNEGEEVPDWKYAKWWLQSVADNIKIKKSNHEISQSGTHKLKIWMIDSGIVFQKFVIHRGKSKNSYLGAPESLFINL
jgi:hypothetical protein